MRETWEIGPGEVILFRGGRVVEPVTTLGSGETADDKLKEMERALQELAPSNPITVEMSAEELGREQVDSLARCAREFQRGIAVWLRGPSVIGSGQIVLAEEVEEPIITVMKDGTIDAEEDVVERRIAQGEPLTVRVEASALLSDQLDELIDLTKDSDVPLRLGFANG